MVAKLSYLENVKISELCDMKLVDSLKLETSGNTSYNAGDSRVDQKPLGNLANVNSKSSTQSIGPVVVIRPLSEFPVKS
jgi:hypothetical protein